MSWIIFVLKQTLFRKIPLDQKCSSPTITERTHLKETPRVPEMAAVLIGEEAAPCTFTHGQATGREAERRDGWAPQISARSHIAFFVPKARSFKLGWGVNADVRLCRGPSSRAPQILEGSRRGLELSTSIAIVVIGTLFSRYKSCCSNSAHCKVDEKKSCNTLAIGYLKRETLCKVIFE